MPLRYVIALGLLAGAGLLYLHQRLVYWRALAQLFRRKLAGEPVDDALLVHRLNRPD